MAKKGKTLFTLAAISAVAAGVYYYYKKNSQEIAVDMDDEDDLENLSDADVDDKPIKRPYVNLDFNTVEQKVKDAASKVADVAETAKDTMVDMLKKGEERVEEFFDDRKAQDAVEVVGVDDLTDAAEDAFSEVADDVADTVEKVGETASEVFFSDAE